MTDIHSCSYFCTRPACVLAQRDELRDRLAKPLLTDEQIEAMLMDFSSGHDWFTFARAVERAVRGQE